MLRATFGGFVATAAAYIFVSLISTSGAYAENLCERLGTPYALPEKVHTSTTNEISASLYFPVDLSLINAIEDHPLTPSSSTTNMQDWWQEHTKDSIPEGDVIVTPIPYGSDKQFVFLLTKRATDKSACEQAIVYYALEGDILYRFSEHQALAFALKYNIDMDEFTTYLPYHIDGYQDLIDHGEFAILALPGLPRSLKALQYLLQRQLIDVEPLLENIDIESLDDVQLAGIGFITGLSLLQLRQFARTGLLTTPAGRIAQSAAGGALLKNSGRALGSALTGALFFANSASIGTFSETWKPQPKYAPLTNLEIEMLRDRIHQQPDSLMESLRLIIGSPNGTKNNLYPMDDPDFQELWGFGYEELLLERLRQMGQGGRPMSTLLGEQFVDLVEFVARSAMSGDTPEETFEKAKERFPTLIHVLFQNDMQRFFRFVATFFEIMKSERHTGPGPNPEQTSLNLEVCIFVLLFTVIEELFLERFGEHSSNDQKIEVLNEIQWQFDSLLLHRFIDIIKRYLQSNSW